MSKELPERTEGGMSGDCAANVTAQKTRSAAQMRVFIWLPCYNICRVKVDGFTSSYMV